MPIEVAEIKRIARVSLRNTTIEEEATTPKVVRLNQPTLKIVAMMQRGTPGNGSDLSYTHNQNTPATVWTVTHNLGKYPSPTVVDSAGTGVEGALFYNSLNQLTFTFSVAFSGKVFCN